MLARRALIAVTCAALALVGAAALSRTMTRPVDRSHANGTERHAHGGNGEAEEQAEATASRLEALEQALANGTFGTAAPIARWPTAGWSGETVLNPETDDWEPALAADPRTPHVYLLTTRYGQPKPCPGNCPSPWIALAISKDGGATWGTQRPLCACKGGGQFDPIIEVVPNTGHVYAVFMNGYNVVFVRSTDHGRTWSEPLPTYGKVSWNDKPVLATSDNGRHVYVSWNGPTSGDPWVTQSHDFGQTWTQTKIVDGARYFFAFDADVLPNGTVVFAESDINYNSSLGRSGEGSGVVKHHAFVSNDRGTTWRDIVVADVAIGEACVAAGCSSDYYIGHGAVAADAEGDLVFLYDGATEAFGPQRIYAKRSTNGGRTWSAAVALSVTGENATSPAVEQVGNGDVRAWYMQTAHGDDADAWNVWFRSSRNGGRTWSAPIKISDATGGADYKTPDGFLEVYGDYGEIVITNTGKTVAAWGEGFSWIGPGGTWINRQV